jgi:hypothetical protein
MTPPEKPFVIGIVGNIGTGKSLVRKMLERLGGLGIDADALAHRTLIKGSPVYEKVVAKFGPQLLNTKGEIERQKLASLVFTNKENLLILENLIHPAVESAGRQIIAGSTSPLAGQCASRYSNRAGDAESGNDPRTGPATGGTSILAGNQAAFSARGDR